METYAPPLRDIRFTLEHLVDLAGLAKLPAFAHADPETVDGLLERVRAVRGRGDRAARPRGRHRRVASRSGDRCRSRRRPGFVDAYRRYVEGGWGSVPFAPEHGGGGFPWLVAVAMQEMLTSANLAFSLCPLLTQGAIDLLSHHGSEEQQERYLRRMVSGEWTGTMNLTEPQAGSDVGALRTRAVPGR